MAERTVSATAAGAVRITRSVIRDGTRAAIATPPADAMLGAVATGLERAARRTPWQLPVLTYHRVDDPRRRPDLYPGLLSATPDAFASQMRHVARRHRVIGLDELVDLRRRALAPPPRALAITFDDGYRDLAEVAWPILRRFGLPATVFVPTALPGAARAFWWDRLWAALVGAPSGSVELPSGRATLSDRPSRAAAFRASRAVLKGMAHDRLLTEVDRLCAVLDAAPAVPATLDWEELRGLAADGLAVAPHSRTHPLLTRVGPEELAGELAGSRADLADRLGIDAVATAYPSGAHDDQVVRATADAGYELAFTTERGRNDLRAADWLRLRRINVGGATTVPLLRLQLLPRPRWNLWLAGNRRR